MLFLPLPHQKCPGVAHLFPTRFSPTSPLRLQIKPWWGKYVTQMQLVQFLIIFAQVIMAWLAGPEASYPDWVKAMLGSYMVTMLMLFGNFYMSKYSKPKTSATRPKDAKVKSG